MAGAIVGVIFARSAKTTPTYLIFQGNPNEPTTLWFEVPESSLWLRRAGGRFFRRVFGCVRICGFGSRLAMVHPVAPGAIPAFRVVVTPHHVPPEGEHAEDAANHEEKEQEQPDPQKAKGEEEGHEVWSVWVAIAIAVPEGAARVEGTRHGRAWRTGCGLRLGGDGISRGGYSHGIALGLPGVKECGSAGDQNPDQQERAQNT